MTEIEIINAVDQFYNSAWDKLIIMASISFGIVGIIVPIIIQWYQKKSLNLSEENLKIEIENQAEEMEIRLSEKFSKQIEDKIKEYEKKIDSLNASSNAKSFHLQAVRSLEKEDYYSALSDFITASFDHLKADDYTNLQTTLTVICENCLPFLSREEVNDIKISHNEDLERLIEEVEKNDSNGALRLQTRAIKLKLSKIPEKKEDTKDEE